VLYMKHEKKSVYDGVYARHIFEHFNSNDLGALIKDISRVLKPGGILVAILPNRKNIGVATSEFWKDTTHVKPYSSEEIGLLIKAAGLEVSLAGNDTDSWDNSIIKNMLRFFRDALCGIKNEPPDYYITAVKNKN
jgi:SAM-dependent methyltransferase